MGESSRVTRVLASVGAAIGLIIGLGACTTSPGGSPPTTSMQVGVCYSIVNGTQSFIYNGPENTLANSVWFNDTDDCRTTPLDNSTNAVLGGQADEATALATCQALIGSGVVANVSLLEPIDPPLDSADYWGCIG